MKKYIIFLLILLLPSMLTAHNITVRAENQPAAKVFRTIVEQTGKNFVYSSDLLQGMFITVDIKNKPLKQVLSEIFKGTDIEYKIKGENIILKRRLRKKEKKRTVKGVIHCWTPQLRELRKFLKR